MNNKSKLPLQIGVGVLIIIIFFAVVVYSRRNSENGEQSVANTPTTETNNSNTESVSGMYKNGTYTAAGVYVSPGGPEEISVTVTIANGIVTNTSANPASENPVSLKFQNEFTEGYKQFVMGKNIADLKLTKVSGSSLTPTGFNDALEKIKAEAAA